MPYSLLLTDRIRRSLGLRPGLTEKKMFGGIGFMIHGNMCCGVIGDDMIVRVDPAQAAAALRQANICPFDMTGCQSRNKKSTESRAKCPLFVKRNVRCNSLHIFGRSRVVE